MAVSYVDSTQASGSSSAGSVTSVACPRPAGVVLNDVLIACVVGDKINLGRSAPSGWTQVGTVGDIVIWRKVAGASEPASYTFTQSGQGSLVVEIVASRGADTATPVSASNMGASSSAVASKATVSVTGVDDGLLLAFFAHKENTNGVSATPPGSMTEAQDRTQGQMAGMVAYEQLTAAGATGTRTGTFAGTVDTAYAAALVIQPGNTAPDAPTQLSPIDGAYVDRAAAIVLDWEFSDPDEGDTQSAYEVERRPSGGGSTSTGKTTSSTTQHSISGGTLSAGAYEWRARTWDAADLVGAWSGWQQFNAANKPATPTITSPANGGTVTSAEAAVTWTPGTETAARVQILNGTEVVHDSGTISPSGSYTASFADNNTSRTVRLTVFKDGLWSDPDDNAVTVAWAPPATPTGLVVEANDDGTALEVSARQPVVWGYGGTAEAFNAASPLMYDLDGWGVTRALRLTGASGNYAECPDAAALDLTGDLTLVARVAMLDWTPGTSSMLVSKYTITGDSGYEMYIDTAGKPVLHWGTGSASLTKTCTVATGIGDRSIRYLKATLDVDNGAAGCDVKFWTSTDGTTWTQLGTTVTTAGTTVVAANTMPLRVGQRASNTNFPLAGAVTHVEVRSGIDGTLVAQIRPQDLSGAGWADPQGNTWTLARSGDARAEVVTSHAVSFNTGTYFRIPDRADLDFTAAESFSAAVGVATARQPSAVRALLAKKQAPNDATTAGWVLWHHNASTFARFQIADATNGPSLSRSPTAGTDYVLVARRDVPADLLREIITGAAATTTADTTTGTLANANPMFIGAAGTDATPQDISGALVKWAALWRILISDAQRDELAAWDGTVENEPTWLRSTAVFYWNADDDAARSAYTGFNAVLNLADSAAYDPALDSLPEVVEYRVWRAESRDGVTWSDPLRVAVGVTPSEVWADWHVAHRTRYRYQIEAVAGDGTTAMSAATE